MNEALNGVFFLSKFDEEERIKLLKSAFYEQYNQGDIIFRQGDIGDKMYIILQGIVIVKVSACSGAEEIIVSALRARDHFGELAVLSQDVPKRRATCVCAESCKFLVIHMKTLKEVVGNLINVKLKEEIKLLKNTPYFNMFGPAELFPILCNIKKQKFVYGEIIVKEGEIPNAMYIIKSGNCRLVIESIGFRAIYKTKFSKNDPSKLYEQEDKKNEIKQNEDDRNKRAFHNYIIYNDDCGKKPLKHLTYQNMMTLAILKENDTFGERSLLPEYYVIKGDKDNHMKPALLSVIADSAEVELLLINRDLLSYFTRSQRVFFLINLYKNRI